MELDDLKYTWNNQQVTPGQQALTTKIIDQVTRKKYAAQIKKIAYPEIIGTLVCLAAVIFTIFNVHKLDTVVLQATGICYILLLLAISVISWLSLQQLNASANFTRPYAEIIKTFATRKLKFYQLQKVNALLCYLLLVTTIALITKLMGGKNITGSNSFWISSFSIGYIFLLLFSSYVKKFYKKTISQAEELINELKHEQ